MTLLSSLQGRLSRKSRQGLNASVVVVGYDFAFGSRRAGTIEDLVELGREFGFDVKVIEAQISRSNETARAFSSTWIRELIAAGETEEAAVALGRAYHVRATVVKGKQRGRTLGFPTANLALSSELCPKPGVYAGWLDWGQGAAPSVVSVGLNPTFTDAHIPQSGQRWSVEVHVLERDDAKLTLYDLPVILWFGEKIREMRRFESVVELREQISLDCQAALTSLTRNFPLRGDLLLSSPGV